MDSLFQMNDLSDLPDTLRNRLKEPRKIKKEEPFVELFRLANRPLSFDEFIVAFYRKHKVVLDRREVINKLYALSQRRNNQICPVSKGVYVIKERTKGE